MRMWSLPPHSNPPPHFFILFPDPVDITLGWTGYTTSHYENRMWNIFSSSYSQWYNLHIEAREGCLNQCSLRPRILLETKKGIVVSTWIGSEDREEVQVDLARNWNKCFPLSPCSCSPPSLILYFCISLHIFCSCIYELHSLYFSYNWLRCSLHNLNQAVLPK